MAEPRISAIRWAKLTQMEETEQQNDTQADFEDNTESIWELCACE